MEFSFGESGSLHCHMYRCIRCLAAGDCLGPPFGSCIDTYSSGDWTAGSRLGRVWSFRSANLVPFIVICIGVFVVLQQAIALAHRLVAVLIRIAQVTGQPVPGSGEYGVFVRRIWFPSLSYV